MLKIIWKLLRPFKLFIAFYVVLISCEKSISEVQFLEDMNVGKKERLDLLLNSPLKINTDLSYFKLRNIRFKKEIFTIENKHFRTELDSIVRYTSRKNSVIEVYKNDLMDKIIFLESNENGFELNYGIKIGMNIHDFESLYPLKVDKFNVARINDSIFEGFYNIALTF